MDRGTFGVLSGVVDLSVAEQREIRGGVAQIQTREDCIRSAYANFLASLRAGSSRASARATLLSDLAYCDTLGGK